MRTGRTQNTLTKRGRYSRVPNNRGVRITVLVGKILEINNHVGPNNSVGGKNPEI